MTWRDDDRHPVVQRRNGRVRRPRDDGERFNRFAWRRFVQIRVEIFPRRRFDPSVPQTGETKWFAAFQHHPEWLPFPFAFLPLVKTVGRNQATPMLERLAKSRAAWQRFRPRIDVGVANAFILRPGRNQAPAHELHRGLVVFVVNHRRKLRRCDVVARAKERHAHDGIHQLH